MELRRYQKEAVNKILEYEGEGKKTRVEIEKGLGRFFIIGEVVRRYTDFHKKILVLTPNERTCYKVKELLENNNIAKFNF